MVWASFVLLAQALPKLEAHQVLRVEHHFCSLCGGTRLDGSDEDEVQMQGVPRKHFLCPLWGIGRNLCP